MGKVYDITNRGFLLLKSDHAPNSGAAVCDKKGRKIGAVVKVFGPVKEPYVSVRPTNKKDVGLGIIGNDLYVE